MPFMRGSMPLRRTYDYLQSGTIVLRKQVQILSIGFNKNTDRSKGAASFVYWHWAQLQYKNPDVQLVKYIGLTPNPWFQAFLEDGQEILIDLDFHTRQQVHDRLNRVLGKTDVVIKKEALEAEIAQSPANFGANCERHCICELPGQQPCTATLPAPMYMKGFWRWNKKAPLPS